MLNFGLGGSVTLVGVHSIDEVHFEGSGGLAAMRSTGWMDAGVQQAQTMEAMPPAVADHMGHGLELMMLMNPH